MCFHSVGSGVCMMQMQLCWLLLHRFWTCLRFSLLMVSGVEQAAHHTWADACTSCAVSKWRLFFLPFFNAPVNSLCTCVGPPTNPPTKPHQPLHQPAHPYSPGPPLLRQVRVQLLLQVLFAAGCAQGGGLTAEDTLLWAGRCRQSCQQKRRQILL